MAKVETVCKGDTVWIVTIYNASTVENVYTFMNEEDAMAKYVSVGNSYSGYDGDLTTADEVSEWFCSSEWWDLNLSDRVEVCSSILEVS